MKSDLKTRHGGKILADALAAHGVKLAFGVPGESYLPVLDGLHDLRDRLRFIICRQEGGASYMAEAYGKLTGEPGVLFVTRGPGATNGSVGVHTALAGLHADGGVHRPGRQRLRRARSVPGNRLPAHVRPDDEMGRRRSTAPSAFPNTSATPSTPRCRAGRARWCSRCPRTCCSREAAVADAPQLPHGRGRRRRRGHARSCRAPARQREAAVRDGRRRRLGPRDDAQRCAAGPSARACRSARRSAARTLRQPPARTTPATSASASTRSSRSA